MALIGPDNRYYRVTSFDVVKKTIRFEIWKDNAACIAGVSDFNKPLYDSYHLGTLSDRINVLADNTKTIKANLITAAYLALKDEEFFKTMTDA